MRPLTFAVVCSACGAVQQAVDEPSFKTITVTVEQWAQQVEAECPTDTTVIGGGCACNFGGRLVAGFPDCDANDFVCVCSKPTADECGPLACVTFIAAVATCLVGATP